MENKKYGYKLSKNSFAYKKFEVLEHIQQITESARKTLDQNKVRYLYTNDFNNDPKYDKVITENVETKEHKWIFKEEEINKSILFLINEDMARVSDTVRFCAWHALDFKDKLREHDLTQYLMEDGIIQEMLKVQETVNDFLKNIQI